jgi:hypothetical protein
VGRWGKYFGLRELRGWGKGRYCIKRNFTICNLYLSDQIKRDEINGACNMNDRRRCAGFWCGSLKERVYLNTQAKLRILSSKG